MLGPIGPAGRRPPRTQMPLRGNKLKRTTSPRVTLGLWKKSWLVKACHYTRIGCGEISLAGFPQEAPTVRPWAVYFLWPADHALFSSPVCDFVGDVPEDIPEGVPLRAEGFPKRRY